MTTLRTTALALLASAATLAAGTALAQTTAAKPATCLVMGKEIPKAVDAACPADVLATLRAYSWEVAVPKLDQDGKPVLDKDGLPATEKRRDGFTLMADMLEAAGLTDHLTTGTVTVFAVPDSVLKEVVPAWTKALADEKLKAAATAAIASHGIDEPLPRGWFTASNGQVWTLAGNYASGAKPISFHDLSTAGFTINGVPVTRADIGAANGVIHMVARPLAM